MAVTRAIFMRVPEVCLGGAAGLFRWGAIREGALTSMIAIERLSKRFDTARATRHLALSDISLDVAEGEFVSILGPSGCGKSTLLYIVGGFVSPSEGAVRVKGAPVTGP